MSSKSDSQPPPVADAPAPDAAPRSLKQLGGLALWKKGLLLVSVICMAAGIALPLVLPAEAPQSQSDPADASGAAADLPPSQPRQPSQPQGLLPTDGTSPPVEAAPDQTPADAPGPLLSPALFRIGFGFFVGFAIAFALRAFVKVSLAIIGLYLLFFLGLEYGGFIEVKWNILSARYDGIAAWLAAEFQSFSAFVTGRIPAGGSALAGVWIGFSRK